jgi:integrase
MRRGELVGLRWSDIDLDAGILTVRQSRVVAGGKARKKPPKSAAGHRSIPLAEPLVDHLRAWHEAQEAHKAE